MKGVQHDKKTSIFMGLCRLLKTWRDDPDRLAVAITAYEMTGYTMAAFEFEHTFPYRDLPSLTQEEALELRYETLHRRPKKLLRAKARGLLMALDALAVDAEEAGLHRLQEDACVIECRVLPIEERIQKLRAKELAHG